MTDSELQAIFDSLELKRGEKLGCAVCGGNVWSYLGGIVAIGRVDDGSYDLSKGPELVAIQCENCLQVITFNRRVLDEFS